MLAGIGIAIVAGAEEQWLFVVLIVGALAFGVLFVLPIGGADMPVVISLLNAAPGLPPPRRGSSSTERADRVGNAGRRVRHVADADDGQGDGRSVANVLFGAFGQVAVSGDAAAAAGDGQVRSASAEDVAVMLGYARRVIIIPGYGLAVAQAQHDVRKLADELERRGVDVRYAIHPVAGRMPGHMNVLLAEANVPYDQLYEMDDINSDFPETDVALVIGANDVTNPAARNQAGSPIYGMPILDVDRAKNVVVIKRSMNPGFAGIDNPLYRDPKTVDAVRGREGCGGGARLGREGALAVGAQRQRLRVDGAAATASSSGAASLLPTASIVRKSCRV